MDRRGGPRRSGRRLAALIAAVAVVVAGAAAQELPTVPVDTTPVRVGTGALLVVGELRDQHSEWSIVDLSADTDAKSFVRDVGQLRVHRRVDLRHLIATATADVGAGWNGNGLFVLDLQTGKWTRIGAATAEVVGHLGGEVIVLDEGRLLRVPWSDPRRSPTMICDAIFDRVFAVAGDRVVALGDDKTRCCVVDLRTGSMRGVELPTELRGAGAMTLDAAVSPDGRSLALATATGKCCVLDLEALKVVWNEENLGEVRLVLSQVVDAGGRMVQWDGADLLVRVSGTNTFVRRDPRGAASGTFELDTTKPMPSQWLPPTVASVPMFLEGRETWGMFDVVRGAVSYRGEKVVLVQTSSGTHGGLIVTAEGRYVIAMTGEGTPRTVVIDAVKKKQRVVAQKTFVVWQWIAPPE